MKNFNLPSELVISLEKMGITTPTEIQKQAIPEAMSGSDILASSQTGSGKTLAYLLPIINSYINNKTVALVLVPTRELAIQININLIKITGQLKLNSTVLIGGDSISKQSMQLTREPKVIIGTPGRVIDHLNRGSLKLNHISVFVLDEMDKMLDIGMKEQLEEINKFLPKKKQVLMFSATISKHVTTLSQKYLNNPVNITVGTSHKAAEEIKQELLHVKDKDKFNELIKQLNSREGSIIIFVKTKRSTEQLAEMLNYENHQAKAIHGDLSQRQRERVILSFRSRKNRIMVATDVAARGLDIPHIQHVINYDLPMCPKDYLHRIGRTGRAGATGYALSFISPNDNIKWHAIDRLISHGESTRSDDIKHQSHRKRDFAKKSNKKHRSFDNNYNKNYTRDYNSKRKKVS